MQSKKDSLLTGVHGSSLKKQHDGNDRRTGIESVGVVPWGTHLCQFYKTKEDLIDILVPYFKAGLENNEFCMWITSEPLHAREAKKALQKVVENLDDYLKKDQIEILESIDWYTKSGEFDANEVLSGWVTKENWAREQGYDGLRLTGNTFWLEKKDWEDFTNYEEVVNNVIGNYKMLAICSYSLDKCNASEIIDVVSNHQFALIKREGTWHRIESSERKKTEAALSESRSLLETVFSSMNEAVAVIDMAGNIIDFNEAFAHFCRFKNKAECRKSVGEFAKIIKSYTLDGRLLPVEEWPAVRALRGDSGDNKEFLIERTDLGITWIASTSFAPLRDKTGEVIGAVQTFQDITERKKSEQESDRQLQYLKQVRDGVIGSDPDFRITYWNPGAEQMYGYTEAEALGKTTTELLRPTYSPGEREKILDELQRIGKSRARIRTRHRDGTEIIADVNSVRITDKNGTTTGYVVTYRDMTERERGQAALREAELKYRTVADNTYDFEFWIDSKGRYLYVSPSCERITGYSKEEFVNNLSLRNKLVHPDDKQTFLNHLSNEALNKNPGELEFRIIHKDGSVRWIHHVCQPLLNEKGTYLGTRGSNRDITERKKIEEQLSQTRDYLENLLNYANAPIIVWGKDFRIIRFNHAFEHLTGYTSEMVIGKKLEILFPEETKVESLQKIRRTLGGEYWESVEIPILCRSKDIKIALWNSANVYDKSGKNLVATIAQGTDITERKKAEEELRETHDYLENLINYANAPIIVWDKNFKIIRFNHAFEHLTGYTSEMVIGKKLEILFPEETKVESLQKIRRTLGGEYWESVEIPILCRSKDIKIALWNSANVYDKSGKNLVATIAQGTDITERKHVELELVRLASFPLKNPNPIVEVDLSGKPVYLNPIAKRLFPDLEKKGATHQLLKGVITLMPELQKKTSLTREAYVNEKCYLQSISYIPENRRIRIYGTDITLRKQTEEILQESEEKYRTIVENTTNVIMVTQPNGVISYVSPACKEVLGHDANELVGTNPTIFYPDDTERVQQAFTRAMKGIKGSNLQYRIITNDGKTKWISHSWTPIMKDGTLQSVVSVIEDINQRKIAEENIKKLNENLLRHSFELATANRELEAFSYSISHDLRAPLRSIDGFGQAILEDYADKLDEQGRDYIKRVRTATQRMGQLIDDLLRLSRLSRAEFHFEPIDLSSLARTAVEKLQTSESSRKIKISIQDKISTNGDKKLLEILFDNLLGNAWKFTGNTKHPTIKFGETIMDDEHVYFIQDNGAGFDMAYADKLFVPFQRLHSVDEYPGTGIGLAIVSRIVHRHGGRIWAESEVGKGATFYFTLQNKGGE